MAAMKHSTERPGKDHWSNWEAMKKEDKETKMPHFINMSLSNLKIYPAMPQGRLQCILVLGQNCPFDITHGIKTYGYSLLFFFFLPIFFFFLKSKK